VPPRNLSLIKNVEENVFNSDSFSVDSEVEMRESLFLETLIENN